MEDSSIQVAVGGDSIFVRICGKGTFKNSPSLKRFLRHVSEGTASSVIFDMSDCITMDSTFMGVLAGAAASLRSRNARMQMVRLSHRNLELLSTLGLNHLIELVSEDDTPDDAFPSMTQGEDFKEMEKEEAGKEETTEVMLDAHENLIRVDPSNKARFEDVIQYLKDSMDSGPA